MAWVGALVARQRMEVSSHIPLDESRDADPPLWRISFIEVVRSVPIVIELAPLIGEQLSMKQFKHIADTFARKAPKVQDYGIEILAVPSPSGRSFSPDGLTIIRFSPAVNRMSTGPLLVKVTVSPPLRVLRNSS